MDDGLVNVMIGKVIIEMLVHVLDARSSERLALALHSADTPGREPRTSCARCAGGSRGRRDISRWFVPE